MKLNENLAIANRSQSLWVRGRFLIDPIKDTQQSMAVAIPLGQGQVFNECGLARTRERVVAIPLDQGQVFNQPTASSRSSSSGRNPFGSGTGF